MMPIALQVLLQSYDQQIGTLAANAKSQSTTAVTEREPIAPLIKTVWHQYLPFRYLCPFDENAGRHTAVGCVALVLAQLMYYYQYPQSTTLEIPASMQWSAGHEAGFTDGKAWLGIPENYKTINAEAEESDPDSILNYYRQLVQLRKDYPIIANGDVRFLETGNENVIAYERTLGGESLTVICNFSGNDEKISGIDVKGRVLIGNWSGSHKIMKPYEVLAVLN